MTAQSSKGYLGSEPSNATNTFMIIDNRAHQIHTVVVHTFDVPETEDPDRHAAAPLYRWQQSEQGQWVFAYAVETPMWHRQSNAANYTTQYAVTAKLKGVDNSFWQLKWGS